MRARTYRYIEKTPLYPFGYGLSYSDIRVSAASITTDPVELNHTIKGMDGIKVEAIMTNNGSVDASDVLQIYVKDLESEFAVKNFNLCGFKRVFLKAGEEKKISLTIPTSALTIVDNSGMRYLDSRRFCFYFGTSQPDERSHELTKKECIQVELRLSEV